MNIWDFLGFLDFFDLLKKKIILGLIMDFWIFLKNFFGLKKNGFIFVFFCFFLVFFYYCSFWNLFKYLDFFWIFLFIIPFKVTKITTIVTKVTTGHQKLPKNCPKQHIMLFWPIFGTMHNAQCTMCFEPGTNRHDSMTAWCPAPADSSWDPIFQLQTKFVQLR